MLQKCSMFFPVRVGSAMRLYTGMSSQFLLLLLRQITKVKDWGGGGKTTFKIVYARLSDDAISGADPHVDTGSTGGWGGYNEIIYDSLAPLLSGPGLPGKQKEKKRK